MIKAKGEMNGRPTYTIGLSFGNLDKFKAEPLDTFIMIRKEESGLTHDIMIFSGRTEREMADLVAPSLGHGSEIIITGKAREGMT
jgi:hypothetical protein